MSSMGLYSIVVKKFRSNSSKPTVEGKENIINRDFKASILTKNGVPILHTSIQLKTDTYLASVMDLYGKKIIGYAYGYFYDDGISD